MIIKAIPFENYEDSLLPLINPLQITELESPFDLMNGDSTIIGFWSICIQQLEFDYYPTVEKKFDKTISENGQLFIIVQQDQSNKIIGFLEIDASQLTIKHFYITENQGQIIFDYSYYNYEGNWLFTLINIQPLLNNVIIQIKDQYPQNFAVQFSQSPIKIFLGGSGQINNSKNLNIFKGRLSRLIFETRVKNDKDLYNFYINKYKIPKAVEGEQTIQLINGLFHFQGNTVIQHQFQHSGDNFCLSGWIKYDFSRLLKSQFFPLIHITTRKNYGLSQYEGDELLLVLINLIPDQLNMTTIGIYRDFHFIPLIQKIEESQLLDFIIIPSSTDPISDEFYEGLIQWHFFRYEYGLYQTILQFYFQNSAGLKETLTGNRQLTNSIYYINIGGTEFYSDLLSAYIFDLKFQFNYHAQKPQYFQNCHYSCLTCNGPFETNCLTCDQESNREYLTDMKKCQCKIGFLEKNNIKCVNFYEYFKSIQILENLSSQQIICKYGYFQFPLNNEDTICIQCPYFLNFDYLCIDCLLNPTSWYLQPQCTKDFISQKISFDNTFSYYQRNEIDYDIFFISKTGIITYYPQYSQFCQQDNLEGCFLSKNEHLEQSVYVQCKNNYYLKNGECIFSDPYCIKVDYQGVCLQSINGMYQIDNNYYQCPIQCSTCYYDNNNKMIICQKCLENYSLINGECKQCGQNCKICQNYFDKIFEIEYLRCFKCIDDSRFFISFDAINCQENSIKHCLYSFQADKYDITINTLDLFFTARNDSENFIEHCARCAHLNQTYILKDRVCLSGTYVSCDFGYANEICDIPIDEEFQKSIDTNLYYIYNSQKLQIAQEGFTRYCTTEQFCLINKDYNQTSGSIQFSFFCPSFWQNCATCIEGKPTFLEGKTILTYNCLICNSGYYLDRISFECKLCPSELNCFQCTSQQILNLDDWKINIKAFYKKFIEQYNIHPYSLYGQSQNISDYFVSCTMCIDGYELYGTTCIKSCPQTCLQCLLINLQYQCIKCQESQQGRLLSLSENECIECPYNCAFCRKRTQKELQSINPLFSNDNYQFYSNQCLKSFQDKEYYYEPFLQTFTDCQNFEECSKQFIIPINLYCQKQDYLNDYNRLETEDEKLSFSQSNILIENIISSSSFIEFENDFFYSQANQKQIRSILINITGSKEQICSITGDGIIQQHFSQNIFSAIDVQLQLIFTKKTVFEVDQTLTFLNFNKILIQGVTIKTNQNNKFKQIIFQSIFSQILQLNKIVIQQNQYIEDKSCFIFNNIQQLSVNNFSIYGLYLSDISYYFFINETINSKIIRISEFQIISSILSNLSFFLFTVGQQDQIELINCYVESQFNNSSLVQSQGNIKQGQISLESLYLKSTINNAIFLNLYQFSNVRFFGLQIKESLFQNVTIILLNNKIEINNMQIDKCSFLENSFGILNSNQLSKEEHNYQFSNVRIAENIYQQSAQFIKIQKFENAITNVFINVIKILNNQVSQTSLSYNNMNIKATQIYLELDNLELNNLLIERGYGFSEFSISQSTNLILKKINITQGKQFKFLGIHQYLDCQLQQLEGTYFFQSIRIVSTQKLTIDDLIIDSVQSYNSPIIQYKSADELYVQHLENIIIKNAIIKNNLLLLTKIENPTSIIFITSQQNSIIQLLNITFEKNILHEYLQDSLQPSTLLLSIDCYKGSTIIQNLNINYNSVYNSSDSIMEIYCKKLQIINTNFNFNSKFNYSILQPYLLWGYQENNSIFNEDLQKVFQILSMTGNGLITVEQFELYNSTVTNSQGYNGGCFKIISQTQSKIQITSVYFENLQNLFINENESGGCLYIDGSSSQSLQIYMKNLTVKNNFARSYGGFIYGIVGLEYVDIYLEQVKFQDVYSTLGSIINIQFSNMATLDQQIFLNNINAIFTTVGFIQYLSQYQGFIISSAEQQKIINNMTLLYIENSNNIKLSNFYIEGLIYQSLLQAINIKYIAISNQVIINSNLKNNLVVIIPYLNQLNQIILNNIRIEQTEVGEFMINTSCQTYSNYSPVYFFKCLTKEQQQPSPQYLKDFSDNKINFGNCFFIKIQKDLDLSFSGLLKFIKLNYYTQIRLNKIKLSHIECSQCQYGLIYFDFSESDQILNQQIINDLQVNSSKCGIQGCFNIIKSQQQINRIMFSEISHIFSLNLEIFINQLQCYNNTGQSGICLNIQNAKIMLFESQILQNSAKFYGGGISIYGKENFVIYKTLIQQNSANVGGGIYLENQSSFQSKKLQTFIINNTADFYGDSISSTPNKLRISFSEDLIYLNIKSIISDNSTIVEQIITDEYKQIDGSYSNDIHLPSGQKISEYYYFDWKSIKYFKFNQNFRILALNQENQIIKNLSNTFCNINSRIFNISSKDDNQNYFYNNYTNIKIIYFSNTTQDYNLDDLIVYFNNQYPEEIYLQLEFNCSSIIVPIYNEQFPYNIINSHKNYALRINIKSFQCQFGEIKNITDYSCTPCDGNQDLFSLQINSLKCEIKDDMSTISVLSAQLNLKSGYWRPYFDSSDVSYCLNLPLNCNGGWIYGDQSCFVGHIGALCEQCDLYDIKGDGQFAISEQYSCGSCQNSKKNIIVIIFISLWTFFLILISVQSNLKTIEEHVKTVNIKLLGLISNIDQNYSAILIKMLTNYFQIICSITTFQLQMSLQLSTFINTVGSPIKTMVYSLDCFLANLFSFNIQYARMVWQLLMPYIYIGFFFLCYVIGVKMKFFHFNRSVISTTLIYMYIYLQPSLIGGLVELLSYREISSFKWILGNVSYRYDTHNHYEWMMKFCLPILLILAFIIPIFFLNRLHFNKQKLDEKRIRLLWGFLYYEYKQQAYFWEIIKIFQKEIIIIFLIYYDQNIIIKASIISLILLLYLELHRQYQPFHLKKLNNLDYQQTVVCLLSMILAAGIYIAQKSGKNEVTFFYATILGAINIYFILNLIQKIVTEYIKQVFSNFESELDKVRTFIRNNFKILNNYQYCRILLKNRGDQKLRVRKLFHKLKQFLIPQAKEIIAFKKYQYQLALSVFQVDENQDQQPSTLRTQTLERQSLIQKRRNETLSGLSKPNLTSYIAETIQNKKESQLQKKNKTPAIISEQFQSIHESAKSEEQIQLNFQKQQETNKQNI